MDICHKILNTLSFIIKFNNTQNFCNWFGTFSLLYYKHGDNNVPHSFNHYEKPKKSIYIHMQIVVVLYLNLVIMNNNKSAYQDDHFFSPLF